MLPFIEAFESTAGHLWYLFAVFVSNRLKWVFKWPQIVAKAYRPNKQTGKLNRKIAVLNLCWSMPTQAYVWEDALILWLSKNVKKKIAIDSVILKPTNLSRLLSNSWKVVLSADRVCRWNPKMRHSNEGYHAVIFYRPVCFSRIFQNEILDFFLQF